MTGAVASPYDATCWLGVRFGFEIRPLTLTRRRCVSRVC